MIKSIVFDWGGVLIDEPADDVIKYCALSLGINPETLKIELSKFDADFKRGTISEKDLWHKICGGLHIAEPAFPSLWLEASSKVFRERKEAWQLVEKLKAKGYKTGLLSNTEIPTMNYFYDNGYDKYFDCLTFSCLEKCLKPDSKIYEITLKRLGTEPQQTIFIDDNPVYVEAATKLGIVGLPFTDYKNLVIQLTQLGVNTG